MGSATIGKEQWHFLDTEGGEIQLSDHPKANVEFPIKWRVFGPLGSDTSDIGRSMTANYRGEWEAKPLIDVAIDKLQEIPKDLTVGGKTLEGSCLTMAGDTLNLDEVFGNHEVGQQAFLMAEIEASTDTEVIFGTGCNWWMDWWIDGQHTFSTMDVGNSRADWGWLDETITSQITATDHCFRHHLTAGRHLIIIRTVAADGAWIIRADLASPRDEAIYKLRHSSRWEFVPDLNEIHPPLTTEWSHTVALRTDASFDNVSVECEFKQLDYGGNVGLIIGAQDSSHYYWAHIPLWAQLFRARAFYAAISVVDNSGHIRNLKMQLMPNVPLHGNIWRSLKVERQGNHIQMWVGGVKGPFVIDDTYGPGRIGIAGFAGGSRYIIRNLEVNGEPKDSGSWPEEDRRGAKWFEPVPDLCPDHSQHGHRLVKLSANEIIMPVRTWPARFRKARLTTAEHQIHFCNSSDAGRTWSQYSEPVGAETIPEGMWFIPEQGIIRTMLFDKGKNMLTYRDSRDKAVTWSEPRDTKPLGNWDRSLFDENCRGSLVGLTPLQNGTLLAIVTRTYDSLCHPKIIPGHGQGTWGSFMSQPFCTLSEDQGLSWAEPVPMDNAVVKDGNPPYSQIGDFTETPVAQLPSGRIVAMTRPFLSPFMWQTHSDDNGQSWRMACYAPFSGAGNPALVATQSGHLAIIKRGPGLALNISTDEGINWDEGTMIDFHTTFNGWAIESEPDVLLVSYPPVMDGVSRVATRLQRIQITPNGPMPLGRD